MLLHREADAVALAYVLQAVSHSPNLQLRKTQLSSAWVVAAQHSSELCDLESYLRQTVNFAGGWNFPSHHLAYVALHKAACRDPQRTMQPVFIHAPLDLSVQRKLQD